MSELDENIKNYLKLYRNSRIEDFYKNRLLTNQNNNFYIFLNENKKNEKVINKLLDYNFEEPLHDFKLILSVICDTDDITEVLLKDFKNRINYNNNEDVVNKFLYILYKNNLLSYQNIDITYFVKENSYILNSPQILLSMNKDIIKFIIDILSNEDYKKLNIDKENIGSYFLYKNFSSYYPSRDEKNKITNYIKSIDFSLIREIQNKKNILKICIEKSLYSFLLSIIKKEKKQKNKYLMVDMSKYLEEYILKDNNVSILEYLLLNSPIKEILKIDNRALARLLKNDDNKIFNILILKIGEEKQIETVIEYNNKIYTLGELWKRFQRNNRENYNIIEKEQLLNSMVIKNTNKLIKRI